MQRSDLATLSKSPRDLYKAQTLTDKTIDDVAAMQVNELAFTQTDGNWTLTDEPGYAPTQSSVKKDGQHDSGNADRVEHHRARGGQHLWAG